MKTQITTPPTPPVTNATSALVSSGEVLHSESHSHLSSEEIARAVARHKREHREQPGKRSK